MFISRAFLPCKVNSYPILNVNFIARMFSHHGFHVTTGNTSGLPEMSTESHQEETQQVQGPVSEGKGMKANDPLPQAFKMAHSGLRNVGTH